MPIASPKLPIPERLVVLTFDDGSISNAVFVAPLLKRLGFGATFFITDDPRYRGEHYLSWEEARRLNDQGLEIGNHCGRHSSVTRQTRAAFAENVEQLEGRCREYGIAAPVTFCYPGYENSLDAVRVLEEKGYRFARRGVAPEYPTTDNGDRGPAYVPGEDHPLLIPTTGASGPNWGMEDLAWAVEQATDGNIAVLTFHGVPDTEHPWVNTDPDRFAGYMEYLRDTRCTVIALRDLEQFVDSSGRPADPYAPIERRLQLLPVDLRCEHVTNPIGVQRTAPRLSWTLRSSKRGMRQRAYRVLVSDSSAVLAGDRGNLWDSGKVESAKSVNISYAGRVLRSRDACWWKVQVWDREGDSAGFSEPARFEMGLLEQTDWCARWIGMEAVRNTWIPGVVDEKTPSPLLRKEFTLTGEVAQARAYFSGIGWSELHINGVKAGDSVLDPAPTDYHKSILYVAHDVTGQVQRGRNAVGIMLGNGWFCEPGWRHPYGDAPRAILIIHVTYVDGGSATIGTDASWKAVAGPILRNDFFHGEVYDARREHDGWATVGYDDSAWDQALVRPRGRGLLKPQIMPPIRVNQTLKPRRLHNPQPGVFVYEFGQLFGGWVRLRARGTAGTEITIKYSARIDPDSGLVDERRHRHGAVADRYLMNGAEAGEEYEPRFTFHPVRYVQLEGYPGTPTLEDVDGRVVFSDVDLSGGFACSNPVLNQIHQAVRWTFTNGLYGIPLDCLYREHWAWTDPATVTGNFFTRKHLPAFWLKWLEDVKESQFENGGVPDIAPNYPQQWAQDPAWGSNYPIMVWYLYQCLDDESILEEHYEGMKKQVSHLATLSEGLVTVEGHFGDHMLPGTEPGTEEFMSTETPAPLVWTGYFYRAATVVAETARALGKDTDAAHYQALAEGIRDAFNDKWFNEQRATYHEGSQTANLLPLALGIVPQRHRQRLLQNTVADIYRKYDGHLHTGNTGTTCLLEALSEHGRGEVLYDIVTTPTYPGWGYMMAHGATTIWENWGGDPTVWKNHPHNKVGGGAESMIMWATVDEFFYHDLAGIKGPKYYGGRSPAPGFSEIVIQPFVADDLASAGAVVRTVRGLISSRWRKTVGGLTLDVLIPPNATAVVHVPTLGSDRPRIVETRSTTWENGAYVPGIEGITHAEADRGATAVVFSVGSGYYRFSVGAPD